jgi:hypothetical protein
MPRFRSATLDDDISAPFAKGAGLKQQVSQAGQWDWGYVLRMRNETDTADYNILSVASGGRVVMGSGIVLDSPVTTERYIWYETSDINRWAIGKHNLPETGSNAGSDFALHRYADDGGYIAVAFFVKRSNGFVGINTDNPLAQLHVVGGGVRIENLPNASPGAGSKQLWYDPADGNRVKFAV